MRSKGSKNYISFRNGSGTLAVFCIVCMVLLSSCIQPKKRNEGKVIARVGNARLTMEMVRNQIPETVFKQDSLHSVIRFRKNWISEQLLVQEAVRSGLQKDSTYLSDLQRLKNGLLAQTLRDIVMAKSDTVTITEKEAENYYEAHEQQFVLNERYVRFRHISTSNLDSCQSAKSAIMHGMPWPEVVQKFALDKDKTLNDSKRYWPISMALRNDPPMNHFLRIIGNTEISPIRFVNGRYQFVQLMEQKPKGAHADLSWVLDQIKGWLKLQKQRKVLSNFERNLYLKAKANHEISISPLNFNQKQDSTAAGN